MIADEPIKQEVAEVASHIACVATPIATLLNHASYIRECITGKEAAIARMESVLRDHRRDIEQLKLDLKKWDIAVETLQKAKGIG